MVRRLESRGGRVRCGRRVTGIEVRGGRAVSVRTEDGEVVQARRAVLADVDAVSLYARLLDEAVLPHGLSSFIQRTFHRGPGTFKLDWALSEPIPWKDADIGRAGTVHLADSVDELTMTFAKLAAGIVPDDPFLLLGQMTTTDPTRSPAGTESAWAYAHVPIETRGDAGPDGITGAWDEREVQAFADRMEARVEALAPGFRDLIAGRHVASPHRLQADNANLVGGDVAGGTQNLHQQLVFRPTPGLARPETPVKGLYLASASAHPGGAVHGACGSNAAIAALAAWRPYKRPIQALTGVAARRVVQKVPPA
jgi:phytoene dehydrogenase-like protein